MNTTQELSSTKKEKEEDDDDLTIAEFVEARKKNIQTHLDSIVSTREIDNMSRAYEMGDRVGSALAQNSELISTLRDSAKDKEMTSESLSNYASQLNELIEEAKSSAEESTKIQGEAVTKVQKNDQKLALMAFVKYSGVLFGCFLAGFFGFKHFRPRGVIPRPEDVDVAYRAIEYFNMFFK